MPPNDFVPNSGQLEAVGLDAVSFRANPAFHPGRSPGVEYLMQVDSDAEATAEGSTIRVHFALDWAPVVENTEFERPFEIELDVVGTFEWDGGVSDEYRQSWTDFNGPYLLWPYIRSYVTWITTTAQLPALVLPTLAVPRTGIEEIDTAEFTAVDPGSTGH